MSSSVALPAELVFNLVVFALFNKVRHLHKTEKDSAEDSEMFSYWTKISQMIDVSGTNCAMLHPTLSAKVANPVKRNFENH